MTVARAIPSSIAQIVEQLELDGDLLVTLTRLADVMADVGVSADEPNVRQLAYELQRGGWLGRLRTRGAWEFLPGARGGAYGSGDRFIEFRAQHAVDPAWGGVLAMESAASVLGLAQRIPRKEVVALPADARFPKALAHDWRYVRIATPPLGVASLNGLRSWNLEGLIFGIAARPSAYEDVAGLGQWLPEAAARVDVEVLIAMLRQMKTTTRQRAAYIVGAAGNDAARAAMIATYPPSETVWLGPRVAGEGVYDAETNVNDTLLHPYLSVGTGS
jgi:AbiEi antitoxin C-terminal domain